METTLGGDRLGSGNKQKISMRNYERSTHDLSYIWRSTMAPGTLVPFMTELALPGDTFDIDLNVNVMTHPTIGPLFGSFKIQLDVFQCPIRLYNGKLHMNKLGIGLNMASIKLPQINITADGNRNINNGDNDQINPSCILSYLNIRGVGLRESPTPANAIVVKEFNAIPYLSYWDIYKNYYANKQEEVGVVIHNPMQQTTNSTVGSLTIYQNNAEFNVPIGVTTGSTYIILAPWAYAEMKFVESYEPNTAIMIITFDGTETIPLDSVFGKKEWDSASKTMTWTQVNPTVAMSGHIWNGVAYDGTTTNPVNNQPSLVTFPLENIDTIRETILGMTSSTDAFTIYENTIEPYGLPLRIGNVAASPTQSGFSKLSSQEGLAIKTYQSDLFNNWVSTEWIDGSNGINEITSVDTTSGSFTIDTLNLANKVYNMLNRIAISGGTYDDWLDAVYTHERTRSIETPMYMGSLIKEITFEEVVSNASSEAGGYGQPLGTLGGKGVLTNKHKGGKIRIKVDEPSYIMGIVSITPRLDYSQGNKWDVNLKTMDDFHKPALDEIGFQSLITDQMAWFDSKQAEDGTWIYKSAGKQPAWINYMTNVNQCRGKFAEKNEQMWMTLNRRYEGNGEISDLTTYIDPVKFNNIFAQTSYDAQNFWVQISNDITARRKMSAKLIPNL